MRLMHFCSKNGRKMALSMIMQPTPSLTPCITQMSICLIYLYPSNFGISSFILLLVRCCFGWSIRFCSCKTLWANFCNAVNFKQGLMCTLGLTNHLIDGGQLRAKNSFLKRDLASLYVDLWGLVLIGHCLSSCSLTQEYICC